MLFTTMITSLASERVQTPCSRLELEHSELKLAFEILLDDNKKLQTSLGDSQQTSAQLRNSLKQAGDECSQLRSQTFELKKRMEVLGIKSAGGSSPKVEQALLKSASDVELLEAERKRLTVALERLCAAAQRFSKVAATEDAGSRLELETESRNAHAALRGGLPMVMDVNAVRSSAEDGLVVSIKEDLAMIVTNFGAREGIKVGMLLRVIRADKSIAAARVVDVREKISGAVLQSLSSPKQNVRVGDRIMLATLE